MAEQMSIAQGLREAKKLKGEIAKQKKRVLSALVYREGDEPAFPFNESMEKYQYAKARLVKLSTEIAVANAVTSIKITLTPDQMQKMTIAQALREMAEIKDELTWYKSFFQSFLIKKDKRTEDEIEVKTGQIELRQLPDGRTLQTHLVKKETQITISNITIAEAEERIEELQTWFELINTAVETANHSTRIEA